MGRGWVGKEEEGCSAWELVRWLMEWDLKMSWEISLDRLGPDVVGKSFGGPCKWTQERQWNCEEWLSYRRLVTSIHIHNQCHWSEMRLCGWKGDAVTQHQVTNIESADTQGEAGSVQVYRGRSVHSQGPYHSQLLVCLHWVIIFKTKRLMFGRPENQDSRPGQSSCPDFIHQKSSFSQLFVIGASCLAANDSFKDGCIFLIINRFSLSRRILRPTKRVILKLIKGLPWWSRG